MGEDCINIYQGPNNTPDSRIIASKHPLFTGEKIVRVFADKIEFWNPDLDSKKTYKLTTHKYGHSYLSFNIDIPVGEYPIDKEESDEDKIVVFTNKKVNK